MKKIKNMSQVELAAYVQDALQADGIQVVLSGGSVVSFYSGNLILHFKFRLHTTGI
ncbi:MAG: hypothetical protein H6634_00075 [Anaerolineales bacterium]|nr:hypothetical protein [Anaerolineales bacterium]